MTNVDREIGWDDQIEHDGADFTLLPEGDYPFKVVGFERGRHGGSEKLPPCNKATIVIECEGKEGISTINHNLFLHTKTEGLICAFFTAIGQRKHGEAIVPKWNQVVGSTGRCKLGIREWTNDQGEKKFFNEVKKFYEPETQPTMFQAGKF